MPERFPFPIEHPDAYFAGIFDGEGWVHVSAGKRFYVQACVKMCDPAIPYMFKDRFGGAVFEDRPENPRHSPSWKWVLWDKRAAVALRSLMPWLLVKRRIAQIGIEAGELLRTAGTKGLSRSLTEEELAQRANVAARAKEENAAKAHLREGMN